MRYIEKNCDLSTEYLEWQSNNNHGTYNSSNNRYYLSVIMQLFRCQNGLCAYTEKRLCNHVHYQEEHWEDGRYNSSKPQTSGQLEHFDPSLKRTVAWSWDNFFMSETDVNTKIKRINPTDDILKPDREGYDPFHYLEYNTSTHLFVSNPNLSETEQQRVDVMISILGLNFNPIVQARRRYIEDKVILLDKRLCIDPVPEETAEFPTALEFFRRNRVVDKSLFQRIIGGIGKMFR